VRRCVDSLICAETLGDRAGRARKLGPLLEQWGLTVRGRREGVVAGLGYRRLWDGRHRSAVSLADGAGAKWEAAAGRDAGAVPLVPRAVR